MNDYNQTHSDAVAVMEAPGNEHATPDTTPFDYWNGDHGKPVWQPIETAPKDRTRFLGIQEFDRGEFVYFLLTINNGEMEDDEGFGEDCTHWMPLPEPPKVR